MRGSASIVLRQEPAALAVLFAFSGFLLWYGERDTRFRFASALLVHDGLMDVFLVLLVGHLYLALVNPSTRQALDDARHGRRGLGEAAPSEVDEAPEPLRRETAPNEGDADRDRPSRRSAARRRRGGAARRGPPREGVRRGAHHRRRQHPAQGARRARAARAEPRPAQDRQHRNGIDFAHAIVDDHSRLAYAEIHPDQRAATVVGFLERALAFYSSHGIVAKRLMTDNAWIYVRSRAVRELLARNEIGHLTTKPYRPRTNGKVERFHQTMAREWAYGLVYRSHRERAAALPHWLDHYNRTRPHSSLGGRPPISRVHNLCGQDN